MKKTHWKTILFLIMAAIVLVPIRVHASSSAMLLDQYLETGFPVPFYYRPGNSLRGQGNNTLIANIDDDPEKEIIFSSSFAGVMAAFNHDGGMVKGWAKFDGLGDGWASAGKLSSASSTQELIVPYLFGGTAVYQGSGEKIADWDTAIRYQSPHALADVDGDGIDEIFTDLGTAYRPDGTLLSGWPVSLHSQSHTPAVADIDNDGVYEVVYVTKQDDTYYMQVYRQTGVELFPPVAVAANERSFAAVADVDGNGGKEIIVPGTNTVSVFSKYGTLLRTLNLQGSIAYSSAVALADLTGDDLPEIIVQTDTHLHAFMHDGNAAPGFPVQLGDPGRYDIMNNAPVVGDVAGDGAQEIVLLVRPGTNNSWADLRVYSNTGVILPAFTRSVFSGLAAVPAISDIDNDGRNEVVVTGDVAVSVDIFASTVWAYDFGGEGYVAWGQFNGGEQHAGVYPVPGNAPQPYASFLPLTTGGSGVPVLPGLRGTVYNNGVPAPNLPLQVRLMKISGGSASTVTSAITDSRGEYFFESQPSLNSGDSYASVYNSCGTEKVLTYRNGDNKRFSDLDILPVTVYSPSATLVSPLPVTFSVERRELDEYEMLFFGFLDTSTHQAFRFAEPLYFDSSYTMYELPSVMSYNVPYIWFASFDRGNNTNCSFYFSRVTFTGPAVKLPLQFGHAPALVGVPEGDLLYTLLSPAFGDDTNY